MAEHSEKPSKGKYKPDDIKSALTSFFPEKDPFEKAVKRLYASLFDKQQAVVDDRASPYRVLCCSRRAGKTQLIARYLLIKALQTPNSEVLYLAPTAKSAREICWDGPSGIPAIIRHLSLERFCQLNETKTAVKFANGTILHLSGCETKVDASRWQGHAYVLVVFDESQDWPDETLKYTIGEVIGPALLDFGGELLMAGVPKPLCAGTFYSAAEGQAPGWSRHHWTVFDNPKLNQEQTKEWVASELNRTQESESDAGPQRRYWGKWVRDDNAQLYNYLQIRNDFTELPMIDARNKPIIWSHVLGIDLGHRDLTTFTLLAWSTQTPVVYGIESRGIGNAIDTDIAKTVKNYQVRYGQSLKLVGDAGGLGGMIIAGLRANYGLAIEPAVKQEKAATIRLMNTALRTGKLLFRPEQCKQLIEQFERLERDPRTEYERPQDPCDFADSCLYAWRWTFAYVFSEPKPPPTQDDLNRLREQEAWERTLKQYPDESPEDAIARELTDWEPPPELDF